MSNLLNDKKLKIIACLKESPNPLTPKEIAYKTRLERSTVRGYLRDLLKSGVLIQPFPSHYSYAATYGVGESISPVHVHNLHLVALCPKLLEMDKIDDEIFNIGSIKIQYVYGKKRGKFSCIISCKQGLDYDSLCLVIDKVNGDFERRFDRIPEFSCSFHMNRDYYRVELDGLKCLTRVYLLGFFERIYQKYSDTVRAEIGLTDFGMEDMISLVRGDLNYFILCKTIDTKLDELVKSSKFQNRVSFDQGNDIERISKILAALFPEDPYLKPHRETDFRNPLVS